MTPHQAFTAPAGLTTPPLSFAARTGDLLIVSASPALTTRRASRQFEAQFGFAVRNILHVLDEADGRFRDLVKVNVLLPRARRRP
jgi:2-iminobutanoate/2-iminopropanoate deaminase